MLPRIGVFHGLLAGFLGMMYLTILYTINHNYFIGLEWLGAWVIILGFMVGAAIRQRSEVGGYIGFRLLVRPVFLTFVISIGILLIYRDFMMGFYDTGLQENLRQLELRTHQQMNMGLDSLEFQKIEQGILKGDYRPFPIQTFRLYIYYIIFGFVLSALITMMFSREKPEI